MTAANTQKGEFTGRHMWLLAVGFFGVIITVNIVMATISQTSWTGLVVENSYVASQEFETLRIAHEHQQAAGWKPDFAYTPGAARLSITDAAGTPVDLGPVTLLINRPVGGHDDQSFTLTRGVDGTYVVPVTLADGVWDAQLSADTALGPFELRERFKVGGKTP